MMMKTTRWFTGIGSAVLFVVGILHGRKLPMLDEMIRAGGVKAPLDGIAKGSFLVFSVEMMGLAVIALVASMMQRGARIVLLCAAIMGVDAVLLFKFLGLFSGVYICVFVTVMFFVGGLLQNKEPA
jgi:hypothetical protein